MDGEVLRVAPTLALPLDAATETFGILAKKGAGKSNAAVVLAEEMYDAGLIARDSAGFYATDAGLDASGVDGSLPASRDEVIALWRSRLPRQAQAFFDVLVAADGAAVDRETLAEQTGYSRSSSQFEPSLRLLAKNGLALVGNDGAALNDEALR